MMIETVMVVLLCGCLVTLGLTLSKLKNNISEFQMAIKHLIPNNILTNAAIIMVLVMAASVLITALIFKIFII